jgi:hypothetical protein
MRLYYALAQLYSVAIGVGGEPGQIAGVVVAELARARLIFDHCGALLERDRWPTDLHSTPRNTAESNMEGYQ